MNDNLRNKLIELKKLIAEEAKPVVNDQITPPLEDPWADRLVQTLEDMGLEPDPSTEEGRRWWETWFGQVIIIIGSSLFWPLIKWLRKNGWGWRAIIELLSKLKGRCPQNSTDPCCVAIKRLAEKIGQWSSGGSGDIPSLLDGLSEIGATLAALSGCPWARDIILQLLQSALTAYLLSLGLTQAQVAELIKKILEWILGGANPGLRPVLIPAGGGSSPDSEQCKPNKDKIEQSLWEKYREQIRDVAYALVVLAAIAAIIAGALAACGGTFVGCAGLPAAITAIIALLASIGIDIGEDEARQLIEDQASAAGCIGTGTETVMASDRIKALRAALRKRLPAQ